MEGFAHWLLSNSFKALPLVGLLWLCELAFGRWVAPRWRHLLWALVVLRLLVPPGLESQLSVYNLRQALLSEEARVEMAAPGISMEIAEARRELASIQPARFHLWGIFLAVWSCGAVAFGAFAWRRCRKLGVVVGAGCPVDDPRVLAALRRCQRRLGVRAAPEAVETAAVSSPALMGVFRPKLLLPPGLVGRLSAAELEHVVMHELAHLKRHDIAFGWLTLAAQTLHWFNPLAPLVGRRLRSLRELACDELVLSKLEVAERKAYGHALIKLLDSGQSNLAATGMAGVLEDIKQITRRIQMIGSFKKRSALCTVLSVSLFGLFCATCLSDATKQTAKPSLGAKAACAKAGSHRLSSFVIPKLQFKDESIEKVAAYLSEQSKAVDPAKKGVVVTVDANATAAKVTLNAEKVPLDKALNAICKAGGLKYAFSPAGVKIFKAAATK